MNSIDKLHAIPVGTNTGRIVHANAQILHAEGCVFELNQHCLVESNDRGIRAKVIGVDRSKAYLMPYHRYNTVTIGARVKQIGFRNTTQIDESWLGRIIDSDCNPLDGNGALSGQDKVYLSDSKSIDMLGRKPIEQPLDCGVRAINGLLTIGHGQRIGLVAGSGVGKSVLLGMIARNKTADVVVVGLIGERNREVKEFIDHNLTEESRNKTIIVASPVSESPLLRVQSTDLCHTIASYFRDKGKRVLLLVESLTRFAMAKREIAMALGELPAIKGYPPSVFAEIPPLLERSGNSALNGTMTGIYTLLAEGDVEYDPVIDTAKAILDGHIVLSQDLAQQGHFPAIDINQSISRCMSSVTTTEHQEVARITKRLWGLYQKRKTS